MSEMELLQRCRVRASELGCRLFRQNTGMAWTGSKVERGPLPYARLGPHDVVIRNARAFHAGFKGMSDLGGWSPIVIGPEMVGETVARYTQAELKFGHGRATDDQMAWIDAVNAAGGRAGVVRSDEDLIKLLLG